MHRVCVKSLDRKGILCWYLIPQSLLLIFFFLSPLKKLSIVNWERSVPLKVVPFFARNLTEVRRDNFVAVSI